MEIKLREETGDYVHIVGPTILSREHIDQIIPHDEFKIETHLNSAFKPLDARIRGDAANDIIHIKNIRHSG